ncbi:hypothetical protein PC9H_010493 [Pleurotus ostreatus]|uniref:GH16 domain-containing protein n=2 Tax=Pleurotus TaxID=5320 RepID=A0A8H7DNC8_PLEOS|nr:uncharacterized protein PC9H_010493 [Pleurotus ostreatus]KAF7422337.1 hypothetical protein PC9H_010493 [Pleurotus ostreatus]KAJ8691837.1 hypothetical protein PTI98_011366 [Pleurotus ostreatus]
MTRMVPLGLVTLCLNIVAPVAGASYDIVKDFAGSSFFDDWDFFGSFDNLTNGDVNFVSASQAQSSRLAFVDSSTNHAIVKVDNTSMVPFNEKRNTVRISTKDRYAVGSVWVADMVHVPFGCSVWPAWWSQSPNWPTGGEIDTFEAVNLAPRSQMGLHTLQGCTQQNPTQSSTLINSTDCNHDVNNNQGCIVTTPSTASYGQAFSAAGGGVWVTEYAETGISVWFFERSSVPSSISGTMSSIDTSTLGTPVANWPSGGCNMDQFFEAQHLILDITLCGDFAGAPAVFSQTCSGVCYNDYVIGSPSNYDNAYFDINFIKIFGTGGNTVISSQNNAAPALSIRPLAVASFATFVYAIGTVL